ncbi:MAG: hypothetical protein OEM96_10365 [Gemmatimonadota bacterium]|nr:hypothetical protein [Gemmatimonadota bacterium]
MTHIGRLISTPILAVVIATCGDPFEPILAPVPEPQEVELNDFIAGSLLDPAAFDLFTGTAVRTDLSTSWDFLFAVDPVLGPTLQAREAVLDLESDAGFHASELAFDDLLEVRSSGYPGDDPVAISPGTVLMMRSRRNPGFSARCRVFGKLEVVAIEGVPAVATLRHVVNPNCERQNVEPGA